MNVPPATVSPSPVSMPAAPRKNPALEPDPRSAGVSPFGKHVSLWDVLTPEEREFFAQQTALGPLSYRPGRGPAEHAPAPTGRRVDVRG